MGTILKKFDLKHEAKLLDTNIFIAKIVVAIFIAYIISYRHDYFSRDTISILFGVAFTLEPIAYLGLKSGIEQIFGSFLGGVCAGLFLLVFGNNPITVALSIGFTVYVCVKMNWRFVPPYAIFSAIYMSQYVQLNALGEPSIYLTLKLRIIALSIGVLSAIISNYLFSFIFNKRIFYKRAAFATYNIKINLESTLNNIKNGEEDNEDLKDALLKNQGTIEEVLIQLSSSNKYLSDINIKEKVCEKTYREALEFLKALKKINHYNYDFLEAIDYGKIENSIYEREKLVLLLEDVIKNITKIYNNLLSYKKDIFENIKFEEQIDMNLEDTTAKREEYDIYKIYKALEKSIVK